MKYLLKRLFCEHLDVPRLTLMVRPDVDTRFPYRVCRNCGKCFWAVEIATKNYAWVVRSADE